MSARHIPIILLATSATLLGCAGDETVAPSVPKSALLDSHGAATTTCVAGAVGVFVSAYPKTIPAGGERSTFYATVSSADGGTLPSMSVQWSIADTNVATMGGPDENGRYYAIGRASGTTVVTGRCGDLSATATISVEGGSPPPTTETPGSAPASVTVTLSVTSLQPGQTAQAGVIAKDVTGHNVDASSVVWASSNAAVATVTPTGIVTAVAAGSASISGNVNGTTGAASISVTSATSPAPTPPTSVETPPTSGVSAAQPELPRAGVPDERFVGPTGRIIRVPAGGGVQEALDAARPGDAVLLTSGASHYGNFVLPANGGGAGGSCSTWTTLTTDASLPPEGVRATPQVAAGFARLLTPNVDAALKTAPGAHCWRVVGVEMAVAPSFGGLHYGLVLLGNGDVSSLDAQPHGVVFDRVYIHGQSTTNLVRCVALNSVRSAIINSWISDCHARGFDSQAIEGWNGPGPYLIENNFLAGAGENIMFGGADPAIRGLIPSDITIRRNHVWKDPSWRGVWTVKNLFELKNAQRLLVEGNIFENNWADAQAGMAIVIKSSHDACGWCTWQGSQDITFRYNIIRNSPRGLNLQAVDGESDKHVARVAVEHNVFTNIGRQYGVGDGWLLLLTHDLKDITIAHNTLIHASSETGFMAFMDYSGGVARNIVIRDNVATKGGPIGAVMYSGVRIGTQSLEAFAGNTYAFDRNVVIGVDPEFVSWHPQQSWYAASESSVGFVNPSAGDYRLGAGSPYKGKASNGTDPGADFDRVAQLTNNVIVR